jgi:hypothetical protein
LGGASGGECACKRGGGEGCGCAPGRGDEEGHLEGRNVK